LNSWHLRMAIRALQAGGVIAYPTEAVYGLGCLPHCWPAVLRILELKYRSIRKGLILVASSLEQLLPYIVIPDEGIRDRVISTWPGPVTWVLPARPAVPAWIRGDHESVAVRVSNHEIVMSLCAEAGPLVSTSANPSLLPPARSILKVRQYFDGELDYIVPGELGGLAHTTPIRDGLTGKILRSGG